MIAVIIIAILIVVVIYLIMNYSKKPSRHHHHRHHGGLLEGYNIRPVPESHDSTPAPAPDKKEQEKNKENFASPANFGSNVLNIMNNYTRTITPETVSNSNEYLPYANENIDNGGSWGDLGISGYNPNSYQSKNFGSANLEYLIVPTIKKDERMGMEFDKNKQF
jgi:hypothetical protein